MLNVSTIVLLVFLTMSIYALYISSFKKTLPTGPGITKEAQEKISFESQNPFILGFNLGLWVKLRIIYFVNN